MSESKKSGNHYKKQFNKLKDATIIQHNQFLRELTLYKHILTVMCKREKNNRLVITLKEVRKLKKSDHIQKAFTKDGDIIFELKK